jgi:polysaccharide biosynthesis/export protein
MRFEIRFVIALVGLLAIPSVIAAEQRPAERNPVGPGQGVTPPAGYVIGADDVISVVFWREKELSAEVVVRPDGNVSLPLLNDVNAKGLTPEEFRAKVTTAAQRFVENPNVSVVIRAINSRKIFVTGSVLRPGTYPLGSSMTVLQAIALASGLTEFANGKNIRIIRDSEGKSESFKFNYHEVAEGKNLVQNIPLRPGDTIVVK